MGSGIEKIADIIEMILKKKKSERSGYDVRKLLEDKSRTFVHVCKDRIIKTYSFLLIWKFVWIKNMFLLRILPKAYALVSKT